jgi:hypothetical protein
MGGVMDGWININGLVVKRPWMKVESSRFLSGFGASALGFRTRAHFCNRL